MTHAIVSPNNLQGLGTHGSGLKDEGIGWVGGWVGGWVVCIIISLMTHLSSTLRVIILHSIVGLRKINQLTDTASSHLGLSVRREDVVILHEIRHDRPFIGFWNIDDILDIDQLWNTEFSLSNIERKLEVACWVTLKQ
jgi:hypothetical protein